VHDGATAGGNPLLREDGTNSALALGSAATPSLKFTGDPNTGIYSPGADQVAISTNGTGRLFVDASGRVGIGNNTPSSSVSVATTGASAELLLDRTDAVTAGALFISAGSSQNNVFSQGSKALVFSTNSGERMRLDSSGRLGLGTSSPGATLTTRSTANGAPATTGTTQTNGAFRIESSLTSGCIDFGPNGSAPWIQATDTTDLSQKYSLLLNPNGGRVGIGTTSVQAILHASKAGAEGFEFNPGYEANRNLTFHYNRTGSNYVINDQSASQHVFRIGSISTEAVRIDANSRLLIGTSSSRSVGSYGANRIQFEGVNVEDSSLSLTSNFNSVNGALITLGKSRSGSIGGLGIVLNNDRLGAIEFAGDDGTDLRTPGARIEAFVDGTPGANDLPSRLVFSTTADGASSPTERMRIDSAGRLLFGTNSSRSFPQSGSSTTPSFQIQGTDIGSSTVLVTNTSSDNLPSVLAFNKSRGTGTVQINDELGRISFFGFTGSDEEESASISVFVDTFPSAPDDMPGRLVFSTSANASSTPTERLRITSEGVLQVADAGNISVGTTTGTKIGTATTQKLGFYNKTPVVQPTAVADATDAASVITQLNALLARMRDLGLIAT
jgi:hypothetical protein